MALYLPIVANSGNLFTEEVGDSGFIWDVNNVVCPLLKEDQKIFVINLYSKEESHFLSVQCMLDNNKGTNDVYMSIKSQDDELKKMKDDEFSFSLTTIKSSFNDDVINGSATVLNNVKTYVYKLENNKDLDFFNDNNDFYYLVKDPFTEKELFFNFKMSKNSVDFKTFKKFCSLDYFKQEVQR
jgi:hypothetical protein